MSTQASRGALVRRSTISAQSRQWLSAGTVIVLASLLFIGLQLYLQNVHIATTNGLWRSIDVRRWLLHPGWPLFDFADALYYPVQSFNCWILGHIGIFPHRIWRQLALLNGVFGGIGAGAVYLFTLSWLRNWKVAAVATALYCGCGFYVLLSIIDEGVMPGAVLVLVATLLACAWFAKPSYAQIATVAVVFSLGWLWQWGLLFPSLPPLLLALFLASGSWWQRIVRPAAFLIAMSAAPAVLAAIFRFTGGGNARAALNFLCRLFWAGKGVGTGWGGFAWDKVRLALSGMTESILGAHNVGTWTWWRTNPSIASDLIAGTVILIVLLGVTLGYAWRHRDDRRVVTATIILGGTFIAGSIFNLYSQPQDPQMVITPMLWTIPAWGLVAAWQAAPGRPSHAPLPAGRAMLVAAAAMTPFCYNFVALNPNRGLDRLNEEQVADLGARFPPARTVFLYQGFEGIITWQLVSWGGGFADARDLPPASAHVFSFKFISATEIEIEHPDWTLAQISEDLKDQIEAALGKGYQVVAGPEWSLPDNVWVQGFETLARPGLAEALRAVVLRNFRLVPVADGGAIGEYSRISPGSAP